MAHRDDREALHAKNVALERELANARQQLASARAPRAEPTSALPSIVSRWASRLGALFASLSPGPALATWGAARGLTFAALAALLIGGTATAFLAEAVLFDFDGPVPDEGPIAIAFWVSTAWVFLGPGPVAWVVARALRAPNAGGGAIAIAVMAIGVTLAPAMLPQLRDAPRAIVGGTARGTIEEMRAHPRAAWARIEPAYVLHGAIGTSVYTRTDSQGRSSSTAYSCAPIVPAIPWNGPISFVACGDRDDLFAAGPGPGFVEGRVEPTVGLELEAVRSLPGLLIDPALRSVTPTLGGEAFTFGLGLLTLLVVLGVGVLGGAILALRVATTKSA